MSKVSKKLEKIHERWLTMGDLGTEDIEFLIEFAMISINALTSIASSDFKNANKTSYWEKIPHKDCAEVIAMDTKIAREVLKG